MKEKNFIVLVSLMTLGGVFFQAPLKAESLNDIFSRPPISEAQSQMQAQDSHSSFSLSLDAIQEHIENDLETLLKEEVKVNLDSHLSTRLLSNTYQDFEIQDLALNNNNTRFTAVLRSREKSPSPPSINLTGKVTTFKKLPVLIRSIKMGEPIQKEDISWQKFPVTSHILQCATTEEELINHEPKYGALNSQIPIRTSQISQIFSIKKGNIITINFENPPIYLQAKGRALDNGNMGNIIRVVNIDSNNTIEAEITGPNQAKVILLEKTRSIQQ